MSACRYSTEGNSPGTIVWCFDDATHGEFCESHYNLYTRFLRNKMAMHLRDYHEVELQLEQLTRRVKQCR